MGLINSRYLKSRIGIKMTTFPFFSVIIGKISLGHEDLKGCLVGCGKGAWKRKAAARTFRGSREQFARSFYNSALMNVPTISVMQAMLQYERNPLYSLATDIIGPS